jgi:ribosomal protein S18 acetylase RimI-like enzyme
MLSGLQIQPLLPAERETAVAVLARAFRDNPLDRAVIGGDARHRLRSIRHGMRASLWSAAGRSTLLLAQDGSGPAGVLLALPPGNFPLPPPRLLVQLRSVLGQGLRTSTRWGEVYRAMQAVHPVEPHWYLSLLGVDPTRRSLGVGMALLRHWLEAVDREGRQSYLETDREENIGFYERVGFAVQRELKVLETPLWCMCRVARAGHPGIGVSHVLDTP